MLGQSTGGQAHRIWTGRVRYAGTHVQPRALDRARTLRMLRCGACDVRTARPCMHGCCLCSCSTVLGGDCRSTKGNERTAPSHLHCSSCPRPGPGPAPERGVPACCQPYTLPYWRHGPALAPRRPAHRVGEQRRVQARGGGAGGLAGPRDAMHAKCRDAAAGAARGQHGRARRERQAGQGDAVSGGMRGRGAVHRRRDVPDLRQKATGAGPGCVLTWAVRRA